MCYKGDVDTNSELLYLRKLEETSSYNYISATHNNNLDTTFVFVIDNGKLSAW